MPCLNKIIGSNNFIYEQDDFQIILSKRFCYFMPCLNKIIGSNNYCHLHNKDSV